MGNKSIYVQYKTLQYGKHCYGVPEVEELKNDYNFIIIDKEKDKYINHTEYLFFKPKTINEMKKQKKLNKETLNYMSKHLVTLYQGNPISGYGNVDYVDNIDQYGDSVMHCFESNQSETLMENILKAQRDGKLECIKPSQIKEKYSKVPEFKEALK